MKKVMTLKEAVATFVSDGSYVSFGGIGDRTPSAAVHEVARQRKKNLRLVSDTAVTFAHDSILIGLGLVDKFEIAYMWGGIWGPDPLYRRAVEKGIPKPIELEEYSNFTAGMRFMAASMGLPFMPTKSPSLCWAQISRCTIQILKLLTIPIRESRSPWCQPLIRTSPLSMFNVVILLVTLRFWDMWVMTIV
ncbi:MAG: CoA transferase subunit A [Bacillota bacterium]